MSTMAPFSSLFASKLNTQALLSGGFPTPSVLLRGRVKLQREKKRRQSMNALVWVLLQQSRNLSTNVMKAEKPNLNVEIQHFCINSIFFDAFRGFWSGFELFGGEFHKFFQGIYAKLCKSTF